MAHTLAIAVSSKACVRRTGLAERTGGVTEESDISMHISPLHVARYVPNGNLLFRQETFEVEWVLLPR